MIPHSFTRYGGTEFMIPQYRNRIVDELIFKNAMVDLQRGSYNPNQYTLDPTMKPWDLEFTIKAEYPSTIDSMADAVSLAFSGNGIYKIKREDGTYRWTDAVIDQLTISMAQREFGLLKFKVKGLLYPRWISTVQTTQTLTGAGGTIVTDSLYPIVNGLHLKYHDSAYNLTTVVTNTTNGYAITYNVSNDGYHDIDVGANIITKNGVATNLRKNLTINTTNQVPIMRLEPGANVITMSGGVFQLDFKWSNVWN